MIQIEIVVWRNCTQRVKFAANVAKDFIKKGKVSGAGAGWRLFPVFQEPV
jgi:hypothetical protein